MEIQGVNGERATHLLEVKGERTEFHWPVAFQVRAVVLDPHFQVLHWLPELRGEALARGPALHAESLADSGKLDEAEAMLRKSMQNTPQSDRYGAAFSNEQALARVLIHRKNWAEAQLHLDAALQAPVRDARRLPLVYYGCAKVAQALTMTRNSNGLCKLPLRRIRLYPAVPKRRIWCAHSKQVSIPSSDVANSEMGSRLRRFWLRISDGIAVQELWAQLHGEARASYRLYTKDLDLSRAQGEKRVRMTRRVISELFWAMVTKLSPARRVLFVVALVLLVWPGLDFRFGNGEVQIISLSIFSADHLGRVAGAGIGGPRYAEARFGNCQRNSNLAHAERAADRAGH